MGVSYGTVALIIVKDPVHPAEAVRVVFPRLDILCVFAVLPLPL